LVQYRKEKLQHTSYNQTLSGTDLKKVLEEHILKLEYYEVIIDIIKRKKQSLGDAATSNTQSMKMEEEEKDEDVTENFNGGVAKVGLIGENRKIHAFSHYSQSH
jgi:hypothetical protein